MGEYLKRIFGQISDFIRGLSGPKQAALGALVSIILVGLILLFYWAGERTYLNLMTNLNPEDSTNIIRILREKQIPFRVDPSGRTISVPPESVDQLRMELATLGLPQTSTVGYELFDKQSLGTTSFVQRVNQKRALEGELMRTIGQIRGVKRSRVHLAIPQKSAFVEDQKKPTASVVLDLEPGIQLSDKQVFGVGTLVARAVEGMDPENVVIVDSMGKQLSKNTSDPLAAATASQLEFKQKLEQEMEHRIEAMFSKVMGEGHVVARVSTDLDFSQVAETQTIYDGDAAAVRSVQKNLQSMASNRPGASGLPGAQSNLPNEAAAQRPGTATDSKTNNEITNYEIPQTVRRTTKPSGTVKRMSVAVVLDGKQVKTPGAAGLGTVTKVEPWPADKLKEFEALVINATGLDLKRGDSLEIKNMEFSREDFDEAQKIIAETERKGYLTNIIVYSLVGLTIILFFLLVIRPFIKWITENTIESVETYLPQTIEELEKLQKNAPLPGLEEAVPVLTDKIDPEKVEGEMIKEKIITLVDANPHKAALIMRDWLHGDKGKGKDKDEKGGGGGKPKSA